MPGTELGFANEVKYYGYWLWPTKTCFKVARFCKIEASTYEPHQDALEFPDGQIVLLTALARGQRAQVLQLPVLAYPEVQSKVSPSVSSEPEKAL
jgi:hypothetical protein